MNRKDIENVITECMDASEFCRPYVIDRIYIRRLGQNRIDIIIGCCNAGDWLIAATAEIKINQLRNSTARKIAKFPNNQAVVIGI